MLSKAYLEFMEGNGNITAVLFNLKLFNVTITNEKEKAKAKDLHDVHDKLQDLIMKADKVNHMYINKIEMNVIERKLFDIIRRFADNSEFKHLPPLKAALVITKGIYYPALRH